MHSFKVPNSNIIDVFSICSNDFINSKMKYSVKCVRKYWRRRQRVGQQRKSPSTGMNISSLGQWVRNSRSRWYQLHLRVFDFSRSFRCCWDVIMTDDKASVAECATVSMPQRKSIEAYRAQLLQLGSFLSQPFFRSLQPRHARGARPVRVVGADE